MIPHRLQPRILALDGVQYAAACPTCLAELPAMPRSRKPCPACGAMMYVRTIDGERALANEAGLEELKVWRREAYAYVGVPCAVCGLTIDRWWRICAYCEQTQDVADPAAARGQLTQRQKEKVIERQAMEAIPELLEAGWSSMTLAEQLLWMGRWHPPLPNVTAKMYLACAKCGRRAVGSKCLECSL